MRCVVLLTLLLGCCLRAWAQPEPAPPAPPETESTLAPLSQRLDERLAANKLQGGQVSIVIRDARTGTLVYEQSSDSPVYPGSLMQIVTAAAALDTIGPEFRFSTEFLAVAPNPETRSAAAVLVYGTGDPTISLRYLNTDAALYAELDAWVRQLRERGVRRITGPVVVDAGAFDETWHAPGWPTDQLGEHWLPSIGAVNFNHNCFEIRWQSGSRDGRAATFRLFPDLDRYLYLSSDVRVGNQPIGRKYRRVRDGNLVTVSGRLPLRTAAVDRAAVEDPGRYFAEVLRERFRRGGVEVTDQAGTLRQLGQPPSWRTEATPIAVRFSPPLKEILQHMMLNDSTLEAEVLFKTMGARHASAFGSQAAGTFQNGTEAIEAWLARMRLRGPYVRIADGSGRSTADRISPAQLLDIMDHALEARTGPIFEGLFPRPGSPGADAARLRTIAEAADVPSAALRFSERDGHQGAAGYVTTASGARLQLALMINDSRLPYAELRRIVDQVLIDLMR